MKLNIAVLSGDGIGPEVTTQAIKVLKAIAMEFNHVFTFDYGLVGACAIDKTNDPLPKETIGICKKADAILFGAIGSTAYDLDPDAKVRPEQGLLRLRKTLDLYTNIRPVIAYEDLLNKSSLKKNQIKDTDILIYRELTGGIYFGEKKLSEDGNKASDTCEYTKHEIERISHLAFKAAQSRKHKLTLVDKANVLESSRLWRRIVKDIATQYPDVNIEYMYIDNAAMELIIKPKQFDVILTDNLFGDLLSDCAAMLTGSLGMLPSASLGVKQETGRPKALYEPVHGSAPDIAGENKANPSACVLSFAMALRYSFDAKLEADRLESAVQNVLAKGIRTADLLQSHDTKPVSCSTMGDAIIGELDRLF